MQKLNDFRLPENFRGKSGLVVQIWWLVQATLFACSPQFAYKWRAFLLKSFGAKIGKNTIIRSSVRITYPWKVMIGDNAWIGDNAELYSLGEIVIGKNSVVSQKCYLCAASHDYRTEAFEIYAEPVVIEEEAWLATDVFVAPGVTIGKGTVIGARSSVFHDMPEGMICLGSPAKPIKPRIN